MHDCPYCRCETRPECTEGHCLHLGAGSYPAQVWFCCRCPHSELVEVDLTTGNSSSWPRSGCKLEIQVT